MIIAIFRTFSWLNRGIQNRLGVAYNVLLSVGLVGEIVHHVQEAIDHHYQVTLRSGLSIVLFVLLLLHQVDELGEHVERRFGRRLGPQGNTD
jgi:hypothetical protein